MSAATHAAATVASQVVEQPFDLGAIDADPEWRRGFAWPRSYPGSAELAETLQATVIGAVRRLPVGEVRHIGILMSGYAVAAVLPLAEAACLVDAERRTKIRLIGQSSELSYLRGEVTEKPARRGASGVKAAVVPRHALLRRLARTATWTPWAKLLPVMVRPQAIALSHNALLRDVAQRGSIWLGFEHGESIFRAAQKAHRAAPQAVTTTDAAAEAANTIAAAVLDAVETSLSDEIRQRLTALVADQCSTLAQEAAHDLAALCGVELPKHVWAGSGGYWPIRAISLEVCRRGGTVTRFDHGGGTGLNRFQGSWALTELSVSDTFFVATKALAARVLSSGAADLLPSLNGTRIVGGYGDPHISGASLRRAGQPIQRRSVLYGPGPLRGFRQVVPALLPDPVALDWQLRLVAQLKALPIELICRPHPEGLLRGRRHPVTDLLQPAQEPFEALLPRTDLFVFDYVQSTTFYLALCTDRPIVLLEMGVYPFTGDVAQAIMDRCRIINVGYDEDNLPCVDPDALQTAVCDGPSVVDSGFFRALILGDGARGNL